MYQELQIDDDHIIIKRPVVVSLFDGISSGLVALRKIGIIPEVYYSSEIDEYCKSIQRFNFGDNIVQLGDITVLDFPKLRELGPVDLLFGGSPCNDFSAANPGRKGLYDETGSGILFSEFLRVHLYFQYHAFLHNRSEKYKWLYENVSSMSADIKNEISKYLGCEPIKLCASQFTGMKRVRYFWTNIHLTQAEILALQAARSGTEENLQKYLCGSGRIAQVKILPTFTSNLTNLSKGGHLPIHDSDQGPGFPFYSEIENLMGLPVNFTSGPNTPLHIRKRVLANTWDVHTIQSLLQPLTRVLALP